MITKTVKPINKYFVGARALPDIIVYDTVIEYRVLGILIYKKILLHPEGDNYEFTTTF
ncbi:MAG: hypothetical protein H0X63_10270 [Flavobacteriales bacterium]|nr:hypothetical protein [Flavobacteriales bacterium]